MRLSNYRSGLDSFTSFLVIKVLKDISRKKNCTVIFTIHQPSYDIWRLFDRITLMVQGQIIYQGVGNEQIDMYFSKIGLPFPKGQNPADFVMSKMHQDDKDIQKNKENFFKSYDSYLRNVIQYEINNRSQSEIKF